MTYTPKTWVTGETITADNLNLITPLVEPIVIDENDNDTTYHEAGYIYNELSKGRLGVLYFYLDGYIVFEYVVSCTRFEGTYSLYTLKYDENTRQPVISTYTANSETEHFSPFIDDGGGTF